MFNKPPKILSHVSALENNNFVTSEYILNKGQGNVNLFNRYCPHRMYPLAEPGTTVENIVCKFHGFEWSKEGEPLNNDRKIACGSAHVGKSGLVFKDFIEPDHEWVNILSKETNLEFSHVRTGKSTGSYLWMMDIQADLLHIRQGDDVVHPQLSQETNLDDVTLDAGNGWALQYCSTGFWLVVYPFTFIEWSPGCLAINVCTPDNTDSEFGFSWVTQFYFDPTTTAQKRKEFETLEDVFREDVDAIEKQKGKYFPLMKSISRLEDHCVHFGKWITENKLS